MSFAPIFNAMLGGWSAKSILKSLSKKYPKIAKFEQGAEIAGFNAPTILKRLVQSKGGEVGNNDFLTEHERTLKRDKQTRNNAAMGLVGALGLTGAAAAGAYKLFSPKINPSTSASPIPSNTVQPPPQTLMQKLESQNAQQNVLPETQNALTRPDISKSDLSLNPTDLERQNPHVGNFVEKHIQAGFSPEEIYDKTKKSKFLNPVIQKIERETGVPYLERIKHLSTGVNPVKGEMVSTPEGMIGSIVDSKKTHSLMEVNGKKHQVKNEGLEPLPKEWQNISVDLSKVPEQDRSAPLNFVAPSTDRKNLAVRFWEGKEPILYLYQRKDGQPIDEETLNAIQQETDVPVTNGVEFTGAWGQGGKSRGSAFHHRLKTLSQSADDGKEDDPTKPYIFKRLPISYEHGFMKAVFEEFKKAKGKFNEEFKPRKGKKRK